MATDYELRIKKIRKILERDTLDGFLTITAEDSNKNIQYLTGFGGTAGALVITPRRAVLVVDGRYIERAKKEAQSVEVYIAQKGKKQSAVFSSYLDVAFEKAAVRNGARIGFEGAHVPHSTFESWKKEYAYSWNSCTHTIERLRQVKDNSELRALAYAGKKTSEVFEIVSKKIRAGLTESDVRNMIDTSLREHGAMKNSFDTIVASGPNSAIPHHETGGRRLQPGDPVVLDFGGVYKGGYCSDITRTIFVRGKKPNKKLSLIYTIVLAANKKAFSAVRAGMTWKDYDSTARTYIEQSGYGEYFSHGLGHSIGLDVHDPYDYARDAFEDGVVMSNEPGIYIPGLGGVRIEDDIVVTKKTAKLLTPASYLSI